MKKTLEIINQLKQDELIRDFAIGGAIGALKWVEPFFTRDLDVFIVLRAEPKNKELVVLTPIYDYLADKGYKKWVGQWLMIEEIPVEFIPAVGLSAEAVKQSVAVDFEGVETKVMTPEYLIALFVKAGRDKDIIKIKMLLEQASVDRKKLTGILKRFNLHEEFNNITGPYNV
jgi:predicted nucleotidyltransferase